MAVNQVNGSNDYYLPENQTRELTQTLDKDAFLKIMIAQLQYQDPTSPMDTSQFIQEMATFTNLEQVTNLNANMERLYTLQQFSSAAALVGSKVTVYDGEEMVTGTVDKVTMSEGSANLWVDGKYYILEQVVTVEGGVADGAEESPEVPGDDEQQQSGDTNTGDPTPAEETGADQATD